MAPPRYESEKKDVSALGKPLDFPFSKRTAQNRFLKAALTEKLSSWDATKFEARGVPSKELVNLYRRWGEGEYGIILTGNIQLDYDQLEAPGNAIIPRDAPYEGARFEGFKELATVSKKHGSLIVGQVSHPGRQVYEAINKHPISASDVQLHAVVLGQTFAKPRAATEEEIKNIIESFAHAAEFLEKAGWDGIELHGAHGYLLSQFLSPTTNKRTDKYGGSLENRARLIVEVGQEIRRRTSENFILSIKVNSVEFQEGGFSKEEAVTLCKILEDNTFDFVELSGGTYEKFAFEHQRDSTVKREAFFLEFAEKIAPTLTKTRTYLTGGFKTASGMVDALSTIDGVGIGRPTTLEPELPRQILSGEVDAAIKQLVDGQDFGMTNIAAGTQMRQLSRDQQPIDLSNEQNLEAFKKDVGVWMKNHQEDKTGSLYGYVDINSIPAVPYARPGKSS